MVAFRSGAATRAMTTWLPSTCQAVPALAEAPTCEASHCSWAWPIRRLSAAFHLAVKPATSGLPSTTGMSTS